MLATRPHPDTARVRFSLPVLPLRATLAALALASAACRDSTASSGAVRVQAVSGSGQQGTVGAALAAPLVARAVDSRGRGVGGVRIAFTVVQGEATLSPATAQTDGDGRAATQVAVGSVATDVIVSAVAGGLPAAEFTIHAAPGALDRVTLHPRAVRLAAVGDTGRFRVSYEDRFRNQTAAAAPSFTAVDPTLFDVDPTTGLVRAKQSGVTGRVAVAAGGKTDTAFVTIADPTASACLGYDSARTLATGEVAIADERTMGICVGNSNGTTELVAIPVHLSGTGGSNVGVEANALGVTATAVLEIAPAVQTRADALQPDAAFDRRLRRLGRTVYAREWGEARARRAAEAGSRADIAAAVAVGPVGSTVTLNASSESSCSATDMRTARIAAVSQTAIVLADTRNPAGGFTDADYAGFAAQFDTLVSAVDTVAFGQPTDVDQNGRIVIFFTSAVNQLSPANTSYYVGGFFHPRDVLTPAQCPASNGGELIYMLVPDPTTPATVKTANGTPARSFSKSFVESITVATLAHEYQHLINAFRRAYVTRAPEDEVDWLNEGLSHIAEELLFHRAAGTAPGQNLGGEWLAVAAFKSAFTQYQKQNYDRFAAFLASPAGFSPWSGTEIQERGAVWAFLRYAADQRAPGQADVWRRLVDSPTSGVANLRATFGDDVLLLERDWLVALVADDYAAGAAARYTMPSWNFRTLFPAYSGGTYPLATLPLTDGSTVALTIRAGSAGFLRFGVPAAGAGLVRLTSAGLPPRGNVQLLVLRTR